MGGASPKYNLSLFKKCRKKKWYRNSVVTKQPSEHYYQSHATFPFPRNRFLRPPELLCIADFCLFGSIFCCFVVTALLKVFPQKIIKIEAGDMA
jgi:hypothetical protein